MRIGLSRIKTRTESAVMAPHPAGLIRESRTGKKAFCAVFLLPFVFFVSCATTVNFRVEHPPVVDMRGIKTIGIATAPYNGGQYSRLTGEVNKALRTGVKKAGPYTILEIDASEDADESAVPDVYLHCTIVNVASSDQVSTKEEKNGDSVKIKRYFTRTVTVSISYVYTRTADGKVLGRFTKMAQSSETFDNTARSSNLFAEVLFEVLLPKGSSVENIAISAAGKLSRGMEKELLPWTAMEKRRIEKEAKKTASAAQAEKLVKQKKYFEALAAWKAVYEQTGSLAAGYNTAVLLEANGQFDAALDLLEGLDEKTGTSSPPFIKYEIVRLRRLVKELEALEDYR